MLLDESVQRQVEQFLFREARLLDEHRYADWLELCTDEIEYWVPSNNSGEAPVLETSIIFDDRLRLEERVFRMTHPAAHALQPLPSVTRVVSGVELAPPTSETRLDVSSVYVLVASRRGETSLLAGRSHHTLVLYGDRLSIGRKKVVLTGNDAPLRNLLFLP